MAMMISLPGGKDEWMNTTTKTIRLALESYWRFRDSGVNVRGGTMRCVGNEGRYTEIV